MNLGKHKKFNKKLFEENDPKARETVINYMASLGFKFYPNHDPYGIDLLSDNGICIEVERRAKDWTAKYFDYPTVHIPTRKFKFFLLKKMWYVIVNNDYTRLGIFEGDKLEKYFHTVRTVRNKYIKKGEQFFFIPVDQFKWINLNN